MYRFRSLVLAVVSADSLQKPIIALMDLDTSKGGLTLDQVLEQLLEANGLYVEWGFRTEESIVNGQEERTTEWHKALVWRGGEELHQMLTEREPIEWNRIGYFQDVTMRLIAERLLPGDCAGTTIVDNELSSQTHGGLPKLGTELEFHIYHSPLNPGAYQLLQELADARQFELAEQSISSVVASMSSKSSRGSSSFGAFSELSASLFNNSSQRLGKKLGQTLQRSCRSASRHASRMRSKWIQSRSALPDMLFVTEDPAWLPKCEHMLLYLTSATWTRGTDSAALAQQVMRAQDLGIHVLLAHEMPGLGNASRNPCEFGAFFSSPHGATPTELLKRGIYKEIAVTLKGGPWRDTSMMMLCSAIDNGRSRTKAVKDKPKHLPQPASPHRLQPKLQAMARLRLRCAARTSRTLKCMEETGAPAQNVTASSSSASPSAVSLAEMPMHSGK